jgi:hypothetical protein
MRRFPNILKDVIMNSEYNLNTISKISGITHTYLTKLINGKTNYPGKDKIATILISLNYGIEEINTILEEYDYRPLNKLDIPAILKNNLKRKIEGSILPYYDQLHYDLLLSALERIGGTKILIMDQPSTVFMPVELDYCTLYSCDKNILKNDFHLEFTHTILKERKGFLLKNIKAGYHFETYLCKKCFNDFLDYILDPDESFSLNYDRRSKHMIRYFTNVLTAIKKNPSQHQMKIVDRCFYFDCQIQDAVGKHPKISFRGKKPHQYENRFESAKIGGFTSDSPVVIQRFINEVEECRKATDKEIDVNYPDNLIEYCFQLFENKNLGNDLKKSFDLSMIKKDFFLI